MLTIKGGYETEGHDRYVQGGRFATLPLNPNFPSVALPSKEVVSPNSNSVPFRVCERRPFRHASVELQLLFPSVSTAG